MKKHLEREYLQLVEKTHSKGLTLEESGRLHDLARWLVGERSLPPGTVARGTTRPDGVGSQA